MAPGSLLWHATEDTRWPWIRDDAGQHTQTCPSLCGDAEGTQRPDFRAPLSFCGTRIDYEVGVARE